MDQVLGYYKFYANSAVEYYKSTEAFKYKYPQNWFLMKTLWPTLAIAAFYLLLVTAILPAYMRRRQEYQLKWPIFLYNFFAVILNVYLIYKVVSVKMKNDDFVLCSNIQAKGDSEASKELTCVLWLFYISKLIELLDTVFFILRKRFHRLTFLHIYHHSTMFVAFWFGVNFFADGYTAIPVLLNSFVHAVMYFYYFMSAFGAQFQRWLRWKSYLAMIQMLQFCILISISAVLLRQECQYKINDRVIWFGIYYSLSHLALFFYSSYSTKPVTPSSNGKSSATFMNDSKLNESQVDDSVLDRSEYRSTGIISKRRPLRSQ